MTLDIGMEDLVLADGLPVYLARPTTAGRFPSVVLLHERYGLVKHTRDLAERLASAGYAVAAPDLYFEHPDSEALHRGDARPERMGDPLVEARLLEAVDALGNCSNADAGRLGMIGVCATGRYSIVYGAHQPLQACVVLHGATTDWGADDAHPETMEQMVSNLDAPVLGLFGEADHGISVPDVCRFRDLLEAHDKSYDIKIYDGVPHGWLNDTMPGRYRKETAALAWGHLLEFFAENLEGDGPDRDRVSWGFHSVKSVDYDFSKNVRQE